MSPSALPVTSAATTPAVEPIPYGCDRFGRLTRVLLHRPGHALNVIDASNHRHWLFDGLPDIVRFDAEIQQYAALLEDLGVQVEWLADHVTHHRELLDGRPNLAYLHDTAVISHHGAFLSHMAWDGRRDEHLAVKEALEHLGVPIRHEFTGPGHAFEGFLLLSPDTLLIADTERHRADSIAHFVPRALEFFGSIIHVTIPKARRYMHPDTIFNRAAADTALAYLPAFERCELITGTKREAIDIVAYMAERGITIIDVDDDEQRRLACSFVPIEPGLLVHYDTALNPETLRRLRRRGVEIVPFHPEALLPGGGSLRCLTLRLHRAAPAANTSP